MQNMNTQFNPYMQFHQSYQQQAMNPYMDRINNLQQFQQSLQPQHTNYLSGKVVDSIDAVKATDIPMDGNMYYFPKADGTEIYVKHWLADGKTRILAFKPVLESETDISSSKEEKLNLDGLLEFSNAFMERFDMLENRFDKLEQSITPKQASKSKKEAEKE